jgi:hypothetical protein
MPFSCTFEEVEVYFLLFGVNDLVQVGEARPPLERDISVEKFLVLLNVASSKNLKSVFVEVTNHARVGVALGGRVVKGRSA